MKLRRASLGIILVLSVGIVAYTCRTPSAGRATLAVRFVTITNDVAGAKVAIFVLTNTGNSPLDVNLGVIELRNTTDRNLGGGFSLKELHVRQSLTVKIVAPQTQDQWRVAFSHFPLTLGDKLRRLAVRLPKRFGIGTHMGRPMVFSTVHTQWMDPTVSIDWTGLEWMTD